MPRQRIPTSILKLRGSWRARYRSDADLPQSIPARPAWLSPEARRHWDRVIPLLAESGILHELDENALARYVETLADWREVQRTIAREGPTYETIVKSTGQCKRRLRPEVRIAARLHEQLLSAERVFGMTPASRSKLTGAGE